jgi:hypothetical protein
MRDATGSRGWGHEAVIRLFIERDDIEPNFKDGVNCLLWLATFPEHERALGDDHGFMVSTLTLLRVAVSRARGSSATASDAGNVFRTTLLGEMALRT